MIRSVKKKNSAICDHKSLLYYNTTTVRVYRQSARVPVVDCNTAGHADSPALYRDCGKAHY